MAKRANSAFMAQRKADKAGLDDYPTPPWAVRALFEHLPKAAAEMLLADPFRNAATQFCWEPAAGRGIMARELEPHFGGVFESDVADYGQGNMHLYDFAHDRGRRPTSRDLPYWVITNPPYNLAEAFIKRAVDFAECGVCMFLRLQFLEGQRRYESVWSKHPPAFVLPFAERVGLVPGGLNPEVRSATAFAWYVWLPPPISPLPRIYWIPPGTRAQLEKQEDYL